MSSSSLVRRVLLSMGMVSCLMLSSPAPGMSAPRTAQDLHSISQNLTQTNVAYGAIPAIHQPEYLSVVDATLSMNDAEPVFIVFFPDGPRIYPQKIMVWHEVVNDYANGASYTITYSPISGCVASYKSNVLGVPLILESEGRLYNNNSVLIDRNTGSLWSQLLGMSFEGQLAGRGLEYIPTWWTDWQHAKTVYPKAKVLMTPRGTQKSYGRDPYGSYSDKNSYYDDERILYPVAHRDTRLHAKTKVLGIEYEQGLLAIDESYVRQKKVVNFFMGATPLVALLDPRLDIIRVFDRTAWHSPALFTIKDDRVVDVDTETIWSYDGKALFGKLKGAQLDELFGINAFWFVWAAFHPETLTVPGDSVVPDTALVKGNKK